MLVISAAAAVAAAASMVEHPDTSLIEWDGADAGQREFCFSSLALFTHVISPLRSFPS
eukprot:COSAG04_NODE_5885_length_1464_cov_2.367033_3_plen_57_part_01